MEGRTDIGHSMGIALPKFAMYQVITALFFEVKNVIDFAKRIPNRSIEYFRMKSRNAPIATC